MSESSRVHVVANGKGGVGKTTVCFNLASVVEYVRNPERSSPTRTAVVSIDRQTTGAFWKAQAEALAPLPLRFDFFQLPNEPARVAELKNSGKYANILVDTAGFRGRNTELETVIEFADDAIVPMNPDGKSLDPTEQIVTGLLIPRQVPYKIVVNDWDPRDGKNHRDDTFAWIDSRGWSRVGHAIRRYRAHASAAEDGLTVPDYTSKTVRANGLEDFLKLALALGLNSAAPRLAELELAEAGES
jgi:chromosome partitioning protein